MKKSLSLALTVVLALCMVFAFVACGGDSTPTNTQNTEATTPVTDPAENPNGSNTPAEPVTIYISAAASLQKSIETIIDLYKAVAPNVTVVGTFDSSGTLQTQIEEGAEADIFFSAGAKQVTALADKNLIVADTRRDMLLNKLVLVVAKGNPGNIKTFEDAAKSTSIALGNSDVPIGQYAQEVFTSLGVWDTVSKNATYGTNVTDVKKAVSEGAVDCGVVYATDAADAGLTVVAEPPAGSLKTPVIYPACILEASKNKDAAKDFLEYLSGADAMKVFEDAGFAKP